MFEASDSDADGTFTLTLRAYDVSFLAFQVVLRYDPATVLPAADGGAAANYFTQFASPAAGADWMSVIGTELDTEEGLIDFTGYVTPGRSVGEGAEPGLAAAGPEGLSLFTLRFKKVGDKPVDIEVAVADPLKPYRSYMPEGAGFSAGGDLLPMSVSIELPDGLGVSSTVISAPAQETPPASARPSTEEERLKDVVILQIGNYAAIAGSLCHIDPANKAVTPYIRSDRTFVPIRFIAEKLGAEVDWDPLARCAVISLRGHRIEFFIGRSTFTVDGVSHTLDAAPEIHGSRTFVPIRALMEATGMRVDWDGENRLVIVSPASAPWDFGGALEQSVTANTLLLISPLLRDLAS